MERRVRGNSHARCGAGEKLEIASNAYLSLSLFGTLIATGYNRIVIGDYGAFVEFGPERAVESNMIVQPGQEYRMTDPRFSERVKYFWYTAKDDSGVKIYFQQKTVAYADYLPGMYYISPYELCIKAEK